MVHSASSFYHCRCSPIDQYSNHLGLFVVKGFEVDVTQLYITFLFCLSRSSQGVLSDQNGEVQ